MMRRNDTMAVSAVTKDGIRTSVRHIKNLKARKHKLLNGLFSIVNLLEFIFFAHLDYFSLRAGKKKGIILTILSFLLTTALIFAFSEGISLLYGLFSVYDTIYYPNIYDAVFYITVAAAVFSLVRVFPLTVRLFKFHAAEHMVINCVEDGVFPTAKNARRYTRFQPRCGSMLVSAALILCFLIILFLPKNINSFVAEIIDIFVIAASVFIARMLMKSKKMKKIKKVFFAPGFLFQRIVTIKPKDVMLECACAAALAVISENAANTLK